MEVPVDTFRKGIAVRNIGCVVIVCIVACVACLFYFGNRGMWGVGKDANYVNAIQYQSFAIPREASDISYCFAVSGSTVDMRIDRGDFVRWCESHGWLVSEIRENSPVARKYLLPDGLVASDLCNHGLQFDARQPDGHGFCGVFDEGKGRASVVWASGR